MAIPIAKAKGLTVITNGNSNNAKSVLALGANRFIDYKTEDYTQTLNNVDYVLDTLGGVETKRQMMIMKQGGQLVSLRAMPNGEFAKRMNLPKWKQVLFKIAGHKFDSMAAKRKVGYHFVYVTSNGAHKKLLISLKLVKLGHALIWFIHLNVSMMHLLRLTRATHMVKQY